MDTEETFKHIRSIDLAILELQKLRKDIYGNECLHERIREVKGRKGVSLNRWCKRCKYQEKESEGYVELTNESWQDVDSFNISDYKNKYS